MDEGIYTNRRSKKDFIKDAIYSEIKNPSKVLIASAFFTNVEIINEILEKNCSIKLIVRLGFPTCPNALFEIINKKSVQIRYYTASSFHPKLFIFGNNSVLLGSANLTKPGVSTNTEIMIRIPSSDKRMTQLKDLFDEYWYEAEVLTMGIIQQYKMIFNFSNKIDNEFQENEDRIIKQIGNVGFKNIKRIQKKKTKLESYISNFSKTYQEYVVAFNFIEEVYLKVNKRKFTENVIPLRLEIDSFISFVKEKFATGDKWDINSISIEHQKSKIENCINEWHKTKWNYFEITIVGENYPLIKRVFQNEKSIKSSNDVLLIDAISVIHSFHDRLRFNKDGLQTLKDKFLKLNSPDKIRDSLSYLIYGSDRIEIRMYNLIENKDYKLKEFGKSNVYELVGWVNRENLPIINGRTTKVLKYFGFDVKQL